jgi:hypothetical protein
MRVARARVSAMHDSADARDREAAPVGGMTARRVARALGAVSAQLIAHASSSTARLRER